MSRTWWWCPGVPVSINGKPGVVVEDPTNEHDDRALVAYTDGTTKAVSYRKLKGVA